MVTDRVAPTEVDSASGAVHEERWAGYRLGDPISLADLLALPGWEDDRLDRDALGRLCLMAPDDAWNHRYPLGCFMGHLASKVSGRFTMFPEPGLLLPRLVHLRGHPIPKSGLGAQTVEPDLAIFDGPPRRLPSPSRGRSGFPVDGLAAIVEIVSPSTFRQDLGLGRSDWLDRWASYLASGVPELWVLNVGVGRPCPLPPGAGLFLANQGDRWVPLPVEGAVHAPGEVHGHRPLTGGRVSSRSTGVTLDLGSLWPTLTPPDPS